MLCGELRKAKRRRTCFLEWGVRMALVNWSLEVSKTQNFGQANGISLSEEVFVNFWCVVVWKVGLGATEL